MRRMMIPFFLTVLLADVVASAAPRQQSGNAKAGKEEAFEWLRNAFMKTSWLAASEPFGPDKKVFFMTTSPRRFEEVRECVVFMEVDVQTSGSLTGSQTQSREVHLGALNPIAVVRTRKRQAAKDISEQVLGYDVVVSTYRLRPVVKVRGTSKRPDNTDLIQESLELEIMFSFNEKDLADRTARALRIAIEGCGGRTEGF